MSLYTIRGGTPCLVVKDGQAYRHKTRKNLAFLDEEKVQEPKVVEGLELDRHLCFQKDGWVIVVSIDLVSIS